MGSVKQILCGPWILIALVIGSITVLGQVLYLLLADNCRVTTDIIFMLDTSQSVEKADGLTQMTDFCIDILNDEKVKEKCRGAIGRFSAVALWGGEPEFQNGNKTIEDLEKLESILKPEDFSTTNTLDALTFISSDILKAPGQRDEAQKMLVFLTDGQSQMPNREKFMGGDPTNDTCLEPLVKDDAGRYRRCPKHSQPIDMIRDYSQNIADQGVEIIAVGITEAVDEKELQAISERYEMVDDFEALQKISGEMVQFLCEPKYWLLSIPLAIILLGFVIQLILNFVETKKLEHEAEELANLEVGTRFDTRTGETRVADN